MNRTTQSARFRLLIACFAMGLAALTAKPGHAGLVLSVESVAVAPGSTNRGLDVLLQNTSTVGVMIDGFSFGLTVAPDITLNAATTSTVAAPYIFAGDSLFGPDITVQSGSPLLAADLFDVPNEGVLLAGGSTVGLGRIVFDVSASAAGSYDVAFSPDDTSLSFQGSVIAITSLVDGDISISAVPEPTSLLLSSIGAAALLSLVRLERSRRKHRRRGAKRIAYVPPGYARTRGASRRR